jgi:hypothetical protein
LRTQTFTVRVPRCQVAALKMLAEYGKESIDTMVVRMFEELAALNHKRLSPIIASLAEAIAWPER